MTVSTRSASNILLQLCSSTAILMTLSGLLFLIGTHLLSILARSQRFIGEIDAISVALIFGACRWPRPVKEDLHDAGGDGVERYR